MIWLNEATASFPKVRRVLIKLALLIGIPRVSRIALDQEIRADENNVMANLAGKRRLLIQIRPSVRREIQRIERVKQSKSS